MANEWVRKTILGNVPATTLNAGIDAAVVALVLASAAGWPADATVNATPMVVAIDLGAANEEKVLVTAKAGAALTVQRGYDGTVAQVHAAGAVVAHVLDAHTVDQVNRLANLLDAVGELIGFNGVNPVAIPAPLEDGDVMTADSGSATGMSWSTAPTTIVSDAGVPSAAAYQLWIDLVFGIIRYSEGGEWVVPRSLLVFANDAARTAWDATPINGLWSVLGDTGRVAFSFGNAWIEVGYRSEIPTITVSAVEPVGAVAGDIWLEPV